MFLRSPQLWSDTVKEMHTVEYAEHLMGIDANATMTTCTPLLPINAPSGCKHKWLSDGLLQLLARAGVGNALDGRCGCGQDVSHAIARLMSLVIMLHPHLALIGTHPRDLNRGMGHVECADRRDIGDANVPIVQASMATKCLSMGSKRRGHRQGRSRRSLRRGRPCRCYQRRGAVGKVDDLWGAQGWCRFASI